MPAMMHRAAARTSGNDAPPYDCSQTIRSRKKQGSDERGDGERGDDHEGPVAR
jgi:hypothetical protein